MALNNQYPLSMGNTVVNLSATHTPEAFLPILLEAAIQNRYVNLETLRQFLTPAPQVKGLLAYGYMQYKESTGDVEWLGEVGDLPVVDESYDQRMVGVQKYGAKIRWTREEQETDRYNMIANRQDRVLGRFRSRENAMVTAAMVAALDHSNLGNDEEMSDWSDKDAGTPDEDVKAAMDRIAELTEDDYTGNVLLMHPNVEAYLYKYDFVKNNQYTTSQFMQTGKIPTLAGLPILKMRAVPDNYFVVFQSGILGEWMSTEGLVSEVWKMNPWKFEQWNWTTAQAVVTHPAVQYRGKVADLS
jgi:HK97 family phage major capsid protein